MHLNVYPLALEKELPRYIHFVALFINSAHAVLRVGYIRMVLSVHPDSDRERFGVLIECFLALALLIALLMVDVADIMVGAGHEWMFLSIHTKFDIEAVLVLTQRVFVVTL